MLRCRYFMFLVLSFLVHQWSVGFFRCGPPRRPHMCRVEQLLPSCRDLPQCLPADTRV